MPCLRRIPPWVGVSTTAEGGDEGVVCIWVVCIWVVCLLLVSMLVSIVVVWVFLIVVVLSSSSCVE